MHIKQSYGFFALISYKTNLPTQKMGFGGVRGVGGVNFWRFFAHFMRFFAKNA